MKPPGGKFSLSILALLLLVSAQNAFGRAGVSGAARGLKNPKSLDGLCTVGNANQAWVKDKYCKGMRDTFLKDCRDKFDRVQKNLKTSGLGDDFAKNCPGFSGLANDELKFSMVLENLSAALAIEESDWRVKATGDGGKSKGVFQISLKVAKTPAYSCGCKHIKSEADVWNGAKNSACGASIIIHWLDQQVYKKKPAGGHVIGGGPAGRPGSSKGLSNYFGPFGDRQKDKRTRMLGKLANWCEQNGTGGAAGLPGDAAAQK
jgi:hypothetical protein